LKRVLFVDDEANLLEGLKRIFRKKKDDWEMVFLDEGVKALDYLSKNTIDFLITDYKMPGMNGLELLTHVKEKYPKIKRVILSGQSEEEIFDRASVLAHKYLSKPCDAEDLINFIDTYQAG
jgi:YesN/AraC family two-component response regulator